MRREAAKFFSSYLRTLKQMTSYYGYNPEKKPKGFSDIYIGALIFGLIAAFILIGGGIGIKYIVLFLIEYWVWVLVLLGIVLIGKHFFKRRSE